MLSYKFLRGLSNNISELPAQTSAKHHILPQIVILIDMRDTSDN